MLRDPVLSWVHDDPDGAGAGAAGGDGRGGGGVGAGRRAARRSLWVFVAFGFGLVAGRALPQVEAPVWFSCACGMAALGLLFQRRGCAILLLAGVVCAGAGWFGARIHQRPADDLGVLLAPELTRLERIAAAPGARLIITVEGVVRDPPEREPPPRSVFAAFAFQQRSVRFTLDVYAVGVTRPSSAAAPDRSLEDWGRPCTGIVTVHADEEAAAAIASGDMVRVTGRFGALKPPMNPGEPDARLWAAQEGRAGWIETGAASRDSTTQSTDGALVHVAGVAAPARAKFASLWRRFVGGVRERARVALLGSGADDDQTGRSSIRTVPATEGDGARALLGALLLGRREAPDADLEEAFTRLGLVHILAISGFHLAVLAGAVMFAVRLTGDHARLEPLLVAAIVLLYLVIVPARTPVVRAGVMVLAFLAAEALARRYDRLTLLGWIAVGVLVWRPLDLWSIGFQLSFGVTAALLWLASHVRGRLFGVPLRGVVAREDLAPFSGLRSAGRWWAARGKDLVSASLLAWGVATPAIAHHVGVVSFLAPVASIIVLPLVLLVLWLGYLALLVGMFVPDMGAAQAMVAAVNEIAAWWVGLTVAMDQAPFAAARIGRISGPWAMAATAAVLYWFIRGHLRDWRAWSGTAVVAAWLILELWTASRLAPAVRFRADMLAVGDGTCMLLRSGDDAVLWDCGSRRVEVGERLVPRAVRALGPGRVSTVILTHPNLDHYSGLLDVVEPLGVERVVVTEFFPRAAERTGSGPWILLDALKERGVEVVTVAAGDELAFGHVRIEFLNPVSGVAYEEVNDTSLVGLLRVPFEAAPGEAGERLMLLTGDIQEQAIALLMGRGHRPDVDALELPHHGSAKPAAVEFVRWCDPEVVLQSTGPSRIGDIRWLEVRDDRDWLVTAADGASFVEFLADGRVRSGAMAQP